MVSIIYSIRLSSENESIVVRRELSVRNGEKQNDEKNDDDDDDTGPNPLVGIFDTQLHKVVTRDARAQTNIEMLKRN